MKKSIGWTIFWLIVFFPYGLFRMWRYAQFPKIARVVISSLIGLIFVISMNNMSHAQSSTTSAPSANIKNVEPQKEISVTYEVDGISITKPSVKVATVADVIDGDTIKVHVDGKDETVRFTLVDTPETKDSHAPVEPLGPEASDFTKQQLSGKQVGLEMDSQERDQYGRLLAYVWVGNELFNGTLIDKGYARVAVYPPNIKYENQFKNIQEYAKARKAGIWSIDNYVTDNGFNMDVTKPKEQPAPAPASNPTPAPTAAPQPEQKTTQQPASQSQQNQGNVFYQNCAAVRVAGKAPLHAGDPSYSKKLDRDGDALRVNNYKVKLHFGMKPLSYLTFK